MNVTESLFRQAQKIPGEAAVLTPRYSLTYAELARAVSFNVARFRRQGLAAGDTVALALPDMAQYLVALLALARLGAAHVAIQRNDPPALREELERRLRIATTVTALPEQDADLKGLPDTPLAAADAASLPFLIKRSSGTTAGAVKLSVHTHAMVEAWLGDLGVNLPEGRGHRFLSVTEITFPGALRGVLRTFDAGGCVALPLGLTRYSELLDFARRERIDYLAGGPVHAAGFLQMRRESGKPLLPWVNALRLSTSFVSEPLRKAVRENLTPNLFIMYGATEIGWLAMASAELVARVPGVVGFPLPGIEIEVVDEAGRRLPAGRQGAVRVRSKYMVPGYLDDEAASARAFRDGWFYVGDIGAFTPKGALVHYGRADDVMIYDGINVHPTEIESALLKHPAVTDAAAFSVSSPARGDVPHAAVVLKGKADPEELRAHCRLWLGARTPQTIIVLDALPRNDAGKVLRRELQARYLALGHGPVTDRP